jgi:hypothetical protein
MDVRKPKRLQSIQVVQIVVDLLLLQMQHR